MSKNSEFEFMKVSTDGIPRTKSTDLNFQKIKNKLVYEATKKTLNNRCLYCGKENIAICNSHFVPAFCLRSLAENGKINTINEIIDIPGFDKSLGIKNAGTFRLICRGCDNAIFSKYEDVNSYEKELNNTLLSQIALKNYLKLISKRNIEINLTNSKQQEFGTAALLLGEKDVQYLDLKEYLKNFSRLRSLLSKGRANQYEIIYYNVLDYVAPIAFQGALLITCDIDGNIINNQFSTSKHASLKELHVCVFPFNAKTVVIVFYDIEDRRYRELRKQFSKLRSEDQLAVINYIIFKYSEDYFFSNSIKKVIHTNDKIKEIAASTSVLICANSLLKNKFANSSFLKQMQDEYSLSNCNDIPNFLSSKYKIA